MKRIEEFVFTFLFVREKNNLTSNQHLVIFSTHYLRMSQLLSELETFTNNITRRENMFEFVIFHALFFVFSFTGANIIDKYFYKLMQKVETYLPNYKNSTWWILTKTVAQLSLVSYLVWNIRILVKYLVLKFASGDDVLFDPQTMSIFLAFVTFYSQDNLKDNLAVLEKRLII